MIHGPPRNGNRSFHSKWAFCKSITANCKLITANCKSITANCKMIPANCKLMTANCKLITANIISQHIQSRFEWCKRLLYCSNVFRLLRIFNIETENQKVIFMSTWVVESNSGLNHHKVWLNISEGTKDQFNWTTSWVGTTWFNLVGQWNERFWES